MNYKLNENNPIEMIRFFKKLSQGNFATELGYPNKAQYSYHMKKFTQDIIEKVKKTYGQDITMDIINYLKNSNRNLLKKNRALTLGKMKINKHESDANGSLESLLNNI